MGSEQFLHLGIAVGKGLEFDLQRLSCSCIDAATIKNHVIMDNVGVVVRWEWVQPVAAVRRFSHEAILDMSPVFCLIV